MKRTANRIEFTHPTRERRTIRFERAGKKAIHAAGGVWGESDWFETLHPDGEAMLAVLAQRMASYLEQGFSISRVSVHDRRAAEVFGLVASPRPRAIAMQAKEERSKARQQAHALLSTPLPAERNALQAELRRCKAVYARSLGAELRRRVRERLAQLRQRLEVIRNR